MKNSIDSFYQAFGDVISCKLHSKIPIIVQRYDEDINFHCLFLMFFKCYRHYVSIGILSRSKIFQDSFILLRCLFESVLCCILFTKNEKHVDRWVKYQQFIYCKEYLKNKALQDSDSTIDKVVLRKEYDELKILFTNTDDKGEVWEDKYWYRGGLRAAASEGKFIKQYEFCYKIGSDFVHSSSKIGQFYVDLQNKEDTIKAIIGAKAQTNIDPIVVFNAMYLMLCAIGAVNDRFEVMEKDVFEYWDKRLSSKMEKHAMRD